MSDLVLVTGATGKTGRGLVSLLKDGGVAHRAASRGGGFDWTRPETWDAALEGVGAAYLVGPPMVDDPYSRMIAFAQAGLDKGVRRFVLLSMASLPAGGPAQGQVHQWLIDHAEDWAVLCPSAFMENFSEGANLATIRDEDRIYSNTGSGHVPFIGAMDIARAAYAALTAPTPLNAAFTLTGDEAISYDRVAEVIGEVAGRPISHTQISTEAMAERFLKRGLPQQTALLLAWGYQTIAEGAQAATADGFRELTGRSPISFEAFAEANAGAWRRS